MTKLPANVLALLKQQLTAERGANATYMALASAFATTAYQGLASFFKKSASDEVAHALKFWEYITDRNEIPEIAAIEAATVPTDYLGALKHALALEESVTEMINAIADAADESGDQATEEFLMYFLKEQVDSEKELQNIIDKVEVVKSEPCALLVIDNSLIDG